MCLLKSKLKKFCIQNSSMCALSVNSWCYVIIATETIGYATIFNTAGKSHMTEPFINAAGTYFCILIKNCDCLINGDYKWKTVEMFR